MIIEKRKLKDLVEYDQNPRRNDGMAIEQVLQSLKNHNQVKPIVISKKGKPFENEVICCGHTLFQASKIFFDNPDGEIYCIIHSFESESDFVKYNIEDNKTSEWAEWDFEKLINLGGSFDIDLKDIGFNMDSILSVDNGESENINETGEKLIECPECGHKFNK